MAQSLHAASARARAAAESLRARATALPRPPRPRGTGPSHVQLDDAEVESTFGQVTLHAADGSGVVPAGPGRGGGEEAPGGGAGAMLPAEDSRLPSDVAAPHGNRPGDANARARAGAASPPGADALTLAISESLWDAAHEERARADEEERMLARAMAESLQLAGQQGDSGGEVAGEGGGGAASAHQAVDLLGVGPDATPHVASVPSQGAGGGAIAVGTSLVDLGNPPGAEGRDVNNCPSSQLDSLFGMCVSSSSADSSAHALAQLQRPSQPAQQAVGTGQAAGGDSDALESLFAQPSSPPFPAQHPPAVQENTFTSDFDLLR